MFEDLITELQGPARELVSAAGRAGLQPRVTSTVRTRSQQARLYRNWQAGLSPLPAAAPGTSSHEFGFAFDMVVNPWEALSDVGYTWQTWGGVWGGDRDPVHFEYPGFVAPPAQEEIDALKAAGEVPWWFDVASMLLPGALSTKTVPCTNIIPADDWRCRYFSAVFCCR